MHELHKDLKRPLEDEDYADFFNRFEFNATRLKLQSLGKLGGF